MLLKVFLKWAYNFEQYVNQNLLPKLGTYVIKDDIIQYGKKNYVKCKILIPRGVNHISNFIRQGPKNILFVPTSPKSTFLGYTKISTLPILCTKFRSPYHAT